jgi:hypothetical protein
VWRNDSIHGLNADQPNAYQAIIHLGVQSTKKGGQASLSCLFQLLQLRMWREIVQAAQLVLAFITATMLVLIPGVFGLGTG